MISKFPRLLIVFYTYVFLSVFLFSQFRILRSLWIPDLFIFVVFIIYSFSSIKKNLIKLKKYFYTNKYLFIFIGLILCLTFIQGLLSAPNTTDSMTYHITRIMYWLQENTVFQDYPLTPWDLMAPFSEYVLTHLYLIAGSDRFLFFSQWLAYLSLLILSYLIALLLPIKKSHIKWLLILLSTLPMAVMQSTSTQSDLVTAVFVLLSLYFSIHYLKNQKFSTLVYFSLSLGLGFLTKATFMIFAIIPCTLFLFTVIKHKFHHLTKQLLVIAFIFFLINTKYLLQNIRFYRNPLGKKNYTNKIFTPNAIASNMIKMAFIHFPVPVFTNKVYSSIVSLHTLLKIDVDDPRTTLIPPFIIQPILYPQEDIAANPLHFLLILLSIVFYFMQKKKDFTVSVIFFSLWLSYFAFVIILSWQPFHSRLLLPFFFVGTIFVFAVITTCKYLRLAALLSFGMAFYFILFNFSRPYISYSALYQLVQKWGIHTTAQSPISFLLKPRTKQYFNARWYWYTPYEKAALVIKLLPVKKNLCIRLEDHFQYPLWVMLKLHKISLSIYPSDYCPQNKNNIYLTTSQKIQKNLSANTQCFQADNKKGWLCVGWNK